MGGGKFREVQRECDWRKLYFVFKQMHHLAAARLQRDEVCLDGEIVLNPSSKSKSAGSAKSKERRGAKPNWQLPARLWDPFLSACEHCLPGEKNLRSPSLPTSKQPENVVSSHL